MWRPGRRDVGEREREKRHGRIPRKVKRRKKAKESDNHEE